MRKGENLEQAVNRWILEAVEKGASGIEVEGLQSTVGNQILDLDAIVAFRQIK